MSGKPKSTSFSAIQVKNLRNTINTEEKLDVKTNINRLNKLSTFAVTLDPAMLILCEYGDRIIESVKSAINCLCSKNTTVLWESTLPATWDMILLHFY
jgi:hypothetical protein